VTTLAATLGIGSLAFALTAAAVPAIRRLARGHNLYEQPVANRWHRRPVAKLGGVAMALVFFPLAFVESRSPDVLRLLVAALALAGLGLFDDLRPIRARAKFAGQLATAALFLVFRPTTLTGAPAADLILAFLWFVGITNAFNLLDNIDGLAAGVTATTGVALVSVLLLARGGPQAELALVTAALAGTALGFLVYNWQPASIFMGDSGSQLLGSVFAGATLLAAPALHQDGRPSSAIALLLLLVPCADTALVTITRMLAGRSPFSGGKDHLSHRLVAAGFHERTAVLLLCLLSALGGAAAIGMLLLPAAPAWTGAAVYALLVSATAVRLARVTVSESGERLEPQAPARTPTLVAPGREWRRRVSDGRPALVYGAGPRGALIVRELLGDRRFRLAPIGFVDDDAATRRTRVEGLRVVATVDNLDQFLAAHSPRIAVLIVADEALPAERLERLCAICAAHAVDVRRLRFSLDDVEWRAHPDVVRLHR
jgi:UDP-GlcNAc:undecaprenyl-phosphate GlcNAc-1-phosphate transferase